MAYRALLEAAALAAALLAVGPAFAAEQSENEPVAGDQRHLHAGVDVSATRLAGETGLLVTPHLAWVLPRGIALGLGLSMLADEVPVQAHEMGAASLRMALLHVRAGHVMLAAGPLELTGFAAFGSGVATLKAEEEGRSQSSVVLALEPGVELRVTPPVLSFLSVGVGGGLRLATRFRGDYLDLRDLSGPYAGAFVRARTF